MFRSIAGISSRIGMEKHNVVEPNQGNIGNHLKVSTIWLRNPTPVSVTLSNVEGCKIIRKTAVKISKPELTLTADHYKIMKGGEVPLQASGAQRYTWSPATALSDPNIPNPVAIPSDVFAIHRHRIRLTRLYKPGSCDHYR